MNTALEQLEHWIEQYKRINGTPPINEILTQIDLLKDYEKEQCNIDLVSVSFKTGDKIIVNGKLVTEVTKVNGKEIYFMDGDTEWFDFGESVKHHSR